jgi:hypothetical protein
MDVLLIVLRLLHIGLGAVWVGMAIFAAIFLTPALQEAGPDGAKVVAGLQRRGMLTVLPLLAIGTLASGLWLYWITSGGFDPGYMGSRMGIAFGTGGAFAIAGFALGITIMRPAMMRANRMAQELASVPPPEREPRAAEIHRLRARAAAVGLLVNVLLVLALAAMAVARYV